MISCKSLHTLVHDHSSENHWTLQWRGAVYHAVKDATASYSVDETLECDYLDESYWASLLWRGSDYHAV